MNKLLPNGRLNQGWLASLSRPELLGWVRTMLHGEDREFHGDRDSEPEYLMDDVWREADEVQKYRLVSAFETLLAQLLHLDLAYTREQWSVESIGRLLYVINTDHKSNLILNFLLFLVREEILLDYEAAFSDNNSASLHFQALTVLVGVWKNSEFSEDKTFWDEGFWEEQVSKSPKDALVTSFIALCDIDMRRATALLGRYWDTLNDENVCANFLLALEFIEIGKNIREEARSATNV